mmetsp:Transcript_28730/g.63534  ORF Transcript_28730/g.63534 Transcript_28730/m.63534 type:complete len:93 (+) Transcript_28730:393-671(+)
MPPPQSMQQPGQFPMPCMAPPGPGYGMGYGSCPRPPAMVTTAFQGPPPQSTLGMRPPSMPPYGTRPPMPPQPVAPVPPQSHGSSYNRRKGCC